jgi:hypothetical protein
MTESGEPVAELGNCFIHTQLDTAVLDSRLGRREQYHQPKSRGRARGRHVAMTSLGSRFVLVIANKFSTSLGFALRARATIVCLNTNACYHISRTAATRRLRSSSQILGIEFFSISKVFFFHLSLEYEVRHLPRCASDTSKRSMLNIARIEKKTIVVPSGSSQVHEPLCSQCAGHVDPRVMLENLISLKWCMMSTARPSWCSGREDLCFQCVRSEASEVNLKPPSSLPPKE